MNNVLEMTNSFLDLGKKIEDLVYEHDIDYIDAVLLYCESANLEVEFVAELIAKNHYIRSKIQREAEDLHFLKKPARLPI